MNEHNCDKCGKRWLTHDDPCECRMKALTPKQEAFCREYVISGNASQAYREAYSAEKMKPESIHRKAFDLTENVKIRARLVELRNETRERFLVTVEEKKKRLWELALFGSAVKTRERGGDKIKKQVDVKGAVQAIKELNLMDGDHAATRSKHELTGKDGKDLNPSKQIDLSKVPTEVLEALLNASNNTD